MKRFSYHLFRPLWAGLFLLVLLTGCRRKSKTPVRPSHEFTAYITGFTSGVISNSDPIMVQLAQDQKVKAGDTADVELVDFEPNIQGTLVWQTPSLLVFRPWHPLPNGKEFKARFHLGKVMQVPDSLAVFRFSFRTRAQALEVQPGSLQAYDIQNPVWNRYDGKILTADKAGDKDVEKCLKAVQGEKTLPIRWSHDEGGRIHLFTVDSIYRGQADDVLHLRWDSAPIGVSQKGEFTVDIPSIEHFKLIDVQTLSDPDQVVVLNFSDPLDPQQDLHGLIRFRKPVKLRFSVQGNTLKIYPVKRLSGARTLVIASSVRNSRSKRLGKTYERSIRFSSILPAVEAVSKGNILPDADRLIFPFKAVNLKAVNVKVIKIYADNIHQFLQVNQLDGANELTRVGRIVYRGEVPLTSDHAIDYGNWNVFALDLKKLFQTEPGALYRVEISFDRSQSLYPCEEAQEEQTGNAKAREEEIAKREDARYDGPRHYYYYFDEYDYDDFDYRQRNNPCSNSYYYLRERRLVRNLLASNLGIIAKEDARHGIHAFVHDILHTRPMADVDIKVYDFQYRLLGSARTGKNGHAYVPAGRKPFLLVAAKGEQRGYVRLDDGSALSVSMFNVGGRKVRQGIKAFLFGERDVWRPGDTVYLQAILDDRANPLPLNHPLVMEVYDPQNRMVQRRVRPKTESPLYDFRFATSNDAPTGNWHVKFKAGDAVFEKTVHIETIKPNRLKIQLKFPDDKLLHTDINNFVLQARWLHGAPASHLKAKVEMRLRKGRTHFERYKEYHFDDVAKSFIGESETLFDGQLDANGKTLVPIKIDVGREAPGMLMADFKTRVFEQGGDFSIDRLSIPVSPFKSYVGVKIPKGKGWNGALYSDEPHMISIVTVDEKGRHVDRKRLHLEVYEIGWRWWWQRTGDDDLGYYLRSSSSKKIIDDYVDTHNGKTLYRLVFPQETWGRKYIRITDPESGHSTGKIFYTDYRGWWETPGHEFPGGVEMLTFSTDKDNYKIGETVRIKLPAGNGGKALVSIENGSDVLEWFTADINPGRHEIQFQTTADMAPNVFVHISYIQPYAGSGNDRPLRLYGVAPVHVVNPSTHLHPLVEVPTQWRPETMAEIKVREQDGRPMHYALFVVDEGLTDLTRFRTPDPWNYFYGTEALGIKTYDMYRYVLGAFAGKIAGLLALGGDRELIKPGKHKASRFKPVVKFLGDFYLEKGKSRIHRFRMPEYIGSVRVMLVAADGKGNYGNAEATVKVKSPLMVLPMLPRVVGPDEKIRVPVSIFAGKKFSNVRIKIKTGKLLQPVDKSEQSLSFDNPGEKMAFFELKVAPRTGTGHVEIMATGGGEKAHYSVEIPIRIANPPVDRIEERTLRPGQSLKLDYSAFGIAGTNKASVEVSRIPSIRLQHRLGYLINYPYGCIEQTVSSVFPQLYLDKLTEINAVRRAQIQDNVNAAIMRLQNFQTSDGGFTYWPDFDSSVSAWGTNYAGHFLLEAKRKGYQVPAGMLNQWIRYQRRSANNWPQSDNNHHWNLRSSQLNQAYRLFTLALAGKPERGAMNRLRESGRLYSAAKWFLAAAYYLAGNANVAKQIAQDLPLQVPEYNESGYTFGSNERDEAIILYVLSLMKDDDRAGKVLKSVVKTLNSDNWLSTQTAAYCLLGISAFLGNDKGENINFELAAPGLQRKVTTQVPVWQTALQYGSDGKAQLKVQNLGQNTLFVTLTNSGIPLQGNNEPVSKHLQMDVRYLDAAGQPVNINRLLQGTDVTVEVRITHPGVLPDYENMALTQIFPSGWEISNWRMDNQGDEQKSNYDYADIRDDRVMLFFDLLKGKTKTFRFTVNASYAGTYYLPAVKCEAMYDHSIMALTAAQQVEVVPVE